ncbi:unnamed protein product [Cylicocyclus nassatus]|uniref:Uncharacterized protein n=1 Tax=Cylicocyclus nassatus TaxID=53992 RepID=A0AA36H857_CYLNA|nr:unnamed protein product [Cylicocyclus nassatus]
MATVLLATVLFAIFSNSHAIWCFVGETKNNITEVWEHEDSQGRFCYRVTTKDKDYIYYRFDEGFCEEVGCYLDKDGDEYCCCNTDFCNYNFTSITTTISTHKPSTLSTKMSPRSSKASPTPLSTNPPPFSSPASSTTLSISQPIFNCYFFLVQSVLIILYNTAACTV